MRRLLGVPVLVIVMLLSASTAADAGTFDTRARWKNCANQKAAISIRATFSNPSAIYGNGRYMVKKWIKWDVRRAAGWRQLDRYYAETSWIKVTNPKWDFVSTAGDVTNWQSAYYSRWRAHVTIKLIKNRPGPKDKTVDTIDLVPGKGAFKDVTKPEDCGVIF